MASAYSWFLALRYLLSRWVNILGMGGVAVSVWALIVVVAVFSGFIEGTRTDTRNGAPDILVAGLPHEASFTEFDRTIRDVPGVAATAPRLSHFSLYYVLDRFMVRVGLTDPMPISGLGFDFIEVVGIDPEREAQTTKFRDWLTDAGIPVENLDRPFSMSPERFAHVRRERDPEAEVPLRTPPGILIGDTRARSSWISYGSELSLVSAREPGNSDDEIRKVRRVFAVGGTVSTRNRVFDSTKALVHIDEMRELLGYGIFDPDVVDAIAVRAEPGSDLVTLAAAIEAAFDDPNIRALTWEQQNGILLGTVDHERAMMKIILLTLTLVAAFLIYATMNMMVTQKIKDVGILSAIGASERGIRDVFLLCGSTIGVVGSSVGAVSGWLTARYLDEINRYFIGGTVTDCVNAVRSWVGAAEIERLSIFPPTLYSIDRIPVLIEPAWIAQVVTVALFTTLFAAWLPARRAAHLEPVRALGYE